MDKERISAAPSWPRAANPKCTVPSRPCTPGKPVSSLASPPTSAFAASKSNFKSGTVLVASALKRPCILTPSTTADKGTRNCPACSCTAKEASRICPGKLNQLCTVSCTSASKSLSGARFNFAPAKLRYNSAQSVGGSASLSCPKKGRRSSVASVSLPCSLGRAWRVS